MKDTIGYGFDIVVMGHLIKRVRDRENEEVIKQVLGEEEAYLCNDISFIGFLANNDSDEVYQKDFEKHFSLTAPTVSNKLRDLQNKGLVKRVYSSVDSRLKQVILTDKAKEIDIKLRGKLKAFESKIDSLLTDEEKTHLENILTKLKNELE